jgi:hypothetical protein
METITMADLGKLQGETHVSRQDVDTGVAIYWDFENVHACLADELQGEGAYRKARFKPQEPLVNIDPVVEYAATFGRIVVHRAYCNWQYYGRYRGELQAHAVELVQLFPLAGSKNGADIRLVLDVVEDMQHQAHVSHVIVVSSDSDYASLAQRCRKQGRLFIGIGSTRTAGSYQFACDEFRSYRDLTVGLAVSAGPEITEAVVALTSPEDAAELVVKAVRRLAADRGESWVPKAAVRQLVKRLDPTFDERHFGFGSFPDLLAALDGYVEERPGEHDHELAVRADLGAGAGEVDQAPVLHTIESTPVALAETIESTPVAVVERQLRRRGLRLPAERQLVWVAPELIAGVFAASATGIEPGFDSLRLKLESAASELGLPLTDVDFNKLKWIFRRANAFEMHGQDTGISLRFPDIRQLRLRLATVLLEHLADPASEDPGLLTEVFFGPDADGEQRQLVLEALPRALGESDEV